VKKKGKKGGGVTGGKVCGEALEQLVANSPLSLSNNHNCLDAHISIEEEKEKRRHGDNAPARLSSFLHPLPQEKKREEDADKGLAGGPTALKPSSSSSTGKKGRKEERPSTRDVSALIQDLSYHCILEERRRKKKGK